MQQLPHLPKLRVVSADISASLFTEEITLTLSCQSEFKEIVDVNKAERWQVYHRLQELDIPCSCAIEQPLIVQIADVVSAVQVWSVTRQFTASRTDCVCWLKRCWQYSHQR